MRIGTTFLCVLTALLVTACAPGSMPAPFTFGNVTPIPPATLVQPTTPVQLAPTAPPAPTVEPTAIVQLTTPAGTPAAAVTPAAVPAGWQVYSNPAGFAIAYPASWTAQAQPDTNNGSIHTEALKGAEGEVDLSWGVGFGGACPSGYTTVKVAQGEIQACYGKNADGSESWSQMSYPLPSTGFSGRALTNNAQQASHDLVLQVLGTLTFAGAAPAAPSAAALQPAQGTTAAPATGYSDPFAYCAAVGTIDKPDARYTGPTTPTSVLPVPVGPGTPSPFPEGSVYWRCMGGNVYTCLVGANIPCWDKADTSTTPNEGMVNYCKDQPNADNIPAFATGHDTIYAWSCKNGAPVMGKQVLHVDPQGYVVEYWHEIPAPGAPPASGTPAATPAAATLQPLSAADCTALANGMAKTLGVKVTTNAAPISDPATGQSGTGCQATATGTGEQFKSPDAPVIALGAMLAGMGWTEDPKLLAGGPTGYGDGYRKDGQMCQAGAIWQPSPAANCSKDQPISACNVTPAQQQYTVTLNCAQSTTAAQSTTPPQATTAAKAATAARPAATAPAARATTAPASGMANPASVNCTKQGGTLKIQTNGTGGQYGVCLFEDNRQCEEWALLRGECPAGGVKVTGYVTPAAQYCAITGGAYTVTGNSNTPNETGTCTLKSGQVCDATAYWNGECLPSTATPVANMANPASVNCVKQGGASTIQTNGAGGQYGVCTFPDNRQCEEWALMRGECPAGGVKVTGYVTPAAQHCAITGGTYVVTANKGTPNETGTCTLKNGQECDATAWWNGGC